MTTATEPVRLLDGEPDEVRRRYPHVAKTLDEMTWVVTPPMLATIQEIYARRLAGERYSELELEERLADARHRGQNALDIDVQTIEYEVASGRGRGGRTGGQIAVLPLYGVMMPRAGLMAQMSGGCSVEAFTNAFKSAVADPDVTSILIDIDSPGGATDLVPELGQAIYDARGEKPIAAIANCDAGSGAYWVAAQVDELAVTPSGMVGSIGCYATHQDLSAALEKMGVRTTIISYGKFKTELNPTEPLSDEAKHAVQNVVDTFGSMFESAVARGRGTTASRVAAEFGQGRMIMAKDAVSAGMADRVATFDQMVSRLARGVVTAGKPTRTSSRSRSMRRFVDAEPSDTCANCPHSEDYHEPDGGPCNSSECGCVGYEAQDGAGNEPLDGTASAGSDRLDALLEGATSRTIACGADELLVLELKGDVDRDTAHELGTEIRKRAGDRQVVVLTNGSTLSVGPDPTHEPAAPAAAQAAEPPARHNLHRRAVRAALRQAASAATEGGTSA